MKNAPFRTFAIMLAAVALMLAFGSSAASAQDADDPDRVDAGMAVYENNCSGCHGADGTGSATGRPLVDIATQADRDHHITSVIDGKGRMPAFGSRLSDEEAADVVSYIRLTFVSDDAADGDADSDNADDEDAAANGGAAAEAPALAKTGVETMPIAIVGATLLLAGFMVLNTARRSRL